MVLPPHRTCCALRWYKAKPVSAKAAKRQKQKEKAEALKRAQELREAHKMEKANNIAASRASTSIDSESSVTSATQEPASKQEAPSLQQQHFASAHNALPPRYVRTCCNSIEPAHSAPPPLHARAYRSITLHAMQTLRTQTLAPLTKGV
eukprot:8849207-Pyramimonas_sp.AAC.1